MSAFIVDYKTIDNILSIRLNHSFLTNYCYFKSEFESVIEKYNDFNIYDDLEELGKEFLKLNIDSVNYRYRDNEDYSWADSYKFNYVNCSLAQTIKSIQCLMYQSCEIENYKENKTYQKLERLKQILLNAFLYINEDYKKAEWADSY